MTPEANPDLLAAFIEEIQSLPRVAMTLAPLDREEDTLALSPPAVWSIIGLLQLALRHPAVDGFTRETGVYLLRWIRLVFIAPGSAMEKIFLAGGPEEHASSDR